MIKSKKYTTKSVSFKCTGCAILAKKRKVSIKTSWSSNFPCMLWLKCYCNPHVGTGALILPTLYVDSRALSLHIRRKVLQGLLSIVLPETSPLHSAYTRSSISEDVPQWYNSSKYWQTSHCNSSYKWSLNLEWNLFLNDCWCIIECQPWDINIVTPPSPSLQWVKHISQCTGEYFPYWCVLKVNLGIWSPLSGFVSHASKLLCYSYYVSKYAMKFCDYFPALGHIYTWILWSW